MQQTDTYKLNLIETTDPFSPAALNENTQKLEEVVHEKLGEMDERIKVFEAKKFAYGNYYNPNLKGGTYEVDVGFRPYIVCLAHTGNGFTMAMVTDAEHGEYTSVKLTDTGFSVSGSYLTGPMNFVVLG